MQPRRVLERRSLGVRRVQCPPRAFLHGRAQAGVTRRVPLSERRKDALRSGRPSEHAQPGHAQCGEPRPSPRESALVPSSRWSPACPSTLGRGPSASTAARRARAHARARRELGLELYRFRLPLLFEIDHLHHDTDDHEQAHDQPDRGDRGASAFGCRLRRRRRHHRARHSLGPCVTGPSVRYLSCTACRVAPGRSRSSCAK